MSDELPDDAGATPPVTPPQHTSGGAGRWVPPSPEHLQHLLPQYEIKEMIGHGGMGAVYKARQVTLDRLVAVKILRPGIVDDGDANFAVRFVNEARTMAKLNHPCIVHVHDFGQMSEGQLYFVMEYVDGTDVAKMIQSQGKLSPDHALAITAHVCDALTYAHEHGVVHRDMKPANVLVNMEGQVKVADFGLAKANDPSHESRLANSSMTMGTPDFIAPEALLVGLEADHRADLFSVGVMLYNMLTGEIPCDDFQPASRCAGCDLRFDAIIAHALQPDRERRYQSALEIRRDLDKILVTPTVRDVRKRSAAAATRSNQRVPSRAPSSGERGKSLLGWLIPAVMISAIALGIGKFVVFKPAEPVTGIDAVSITGEKSPENIADGPGVASETATPATGSVPPTGDPMTTPPRNRGGREKETSAPPSVAPPMSEPLEPGGSSTPSAIASTHLPVLPAQLRELVTQYEKLRVERVTTPFEAGIAKLNAGYLDGLDRESANEKSAGHLEAVLTLEEERKLVKNAGPVRLDTMGPVAPSSDDDKSQGILRKLRGIYRLEMAKLDVHLASNEAALRVSYLARLKQLETDLTKAGVLAEAKAVMDYRERIAAGVPEKDAVTAANNKDDIPANALVIEALIDGPSELRVKKDGIYWINIKNAKPGRHLDTNEATYINGEPWQPHWKDERNKNGPDQSDVRSISPFVGISALELMLISVKTKRGEEGIDNRDPIRTKVVDEEFSVLIPDRQGGSRWYKFALVPRKR